MGVNLSLTGADAHSAKLMLDGAQLAFDQANQSHAVPGYTFEAVALDLSELRRGADRFTLSIRDREGNVVASVDGSLTEGDIKSLTP